MNDDVLVIGGEYNERFFDCYFHTPKYVIKKKDIRETITVKSCNVVNNKDFWYIEILTKQEIINT